MKSIFASKLYKSSTRKDRIQAALAAPGNLSLVQQLADSLDEEYKTPENLGMESESSNDDLIVDEDIDPEKDLVNLDSEDERSESEPSSTPKRKASFVPSSPKPGKSDDLDSEEPKHSDVDTSELIPDSPATEEKPEKKEEPAEDSTKVTATTDVRINPVPAEAIDLNVLKATLNSREDTSGVTRVAEKENEIWIYYKDEINLNNIMTDVIEFIMNTAEYKCFTFNRLARSDNAIVFVTTLESYQYPEKIVEEALEDRK